MGMMAVFNMADMRGSLTYEMHVQKNESNKNYNVGSTTVVL